jgi:hypothetical protein
MKTHEHQQNLIFLQVKIPANKHIITQNLAKMK